MVVRGPYINPAYLASFKKSSSSQLETRRPCVENIEDAEQFREKITSGGLTVCFFTDSMFNPCRYYESVFQQVAFDFKDNARFIRVDTDKIELRKIALQEEVRTFPTVSFYQSGLELVSIIGTNESRLRHFVMEYKPTVNGGEIATKKIRRVKSEDEFLELVHLGRLSVAVFYSKKCLFCQQRSDIFRII